MTLRVTSSDKSKNWLVLVGYVVCPLPHPTNSGTHSLPSLPNLCDGLGSRLSCPLASSWVWPMGGTSRRMESGKRERLGYFFPLQSPLGEVLLAVAASSSDIASVLHSPSRTLAPFLYFY